MFDEEQPAAAFLLKVYQDFKQTIIEANISRVFAAIGLTHNIEQSPDACFIFSTVACSHFNQFSFQQRSSEFCALSVPRVSIRPSGSSRHSHVLSTPLISLRRDLNPHVKSDLTRHNGHARLSIYAV
jgi:hypothetical protein